MMKTKLVRHPTLGSGPSIVTMSTWTQAWGSAKVQSCDSTASPKLVAAGMPICVASDKIELLPQVIREVQLVTDILILDMKATDP